MSGWGSTPAVAVSDPTPSSADLHTEKFSKDKNMARMKKMSTVTANGNRLEQLENLSKILAAQIDQCTSDTDSAKMIPQLARQYRETIREIEEIRGMEKDDDEIGEILSNRNADGKPNAIR